jgi:hypothetical protein
MTQATDEPYTIYDLSTSGEVRRIAEITAANYREALKEARRLLPHGPGEIRTNGRVVCRFGRTQPFMLGG